MTLLPHHHNPPPDLLVEGEQVQLHDGGAERSQVSGDQRRHTVEKFLTHQRSSCYKTKQYLMPWKPWIKIYWMFSQRADAWPLMSSVWPTVAICATYVYFVKVLGPRWGLFLVMALVLVLVLVIFLPGHGLG